MAYEKPPVRKYAGGIELRQENAFDATPAQKATKIPVARVGIAVIRGPDPDREPVPRSEAAAMIVASDFREVVKNTLQGFLTLSLSPSGVVLHECSLHERPEGQRWIGLPSRPQLDSAGVHLKDPVTGKKLYVPVVEIRGLREREQFQRCALAAVDKLLGRGAP